MPTPFASNLISLDSLVATLPTAEREPKVNMTWVRFALYYVRTHPKLAGLTTEADDLAYAVGLTLRRLQGLHDAWVAHPDFYPTQLPVAMTAWKHEPYLGHGHSFICAEVDDLLSSRWLQWGKRSLGAFAGIAPVAPWMGVDKSRVTTLSWSLHGSGKAFRARMALKAMLPHKYRPLVQKTRHFNRKDKYQCWRAYKGGRNPPKDAEYYALTANDLRFWEFTTHYAESLAGLEKYLSLKDFWAIATGKIHPEEVYKYFTFQTDMFLAVQFGGKPNALR